jgi:uncharacterized membrane protein YeaQ/YmgE (transglycosylase-associated protein family)
MFFRCLLLPSASELGGGFTPRNPPPILRDDLRVLSQPKGENKVTWILIIIGGILGWIASKIMRTDAQQGIFLNIVVGIVGAMLAGFLLSPLLGIPSINAGDFSIGALLISLLGAVILLAIVNFFRRGRAR